MPLRHWLAALLVVLLWGLNFVVIKFGVDEFPPLLLGALRFAMVAFPAILFIPRPVISLRLLLLFGLTLCFGQFAFLFSAIALGMPAGLASLVLQSQAFFSVLIAAMLLNEKVRIHSIIAMVVAAIGLAVIEMGADLAQPVPLFAFFLTLCGVQLGLRQHRHQKGRPGRQYVQSAHLGRRVSGFPVSAGLVADRRTAGHRAQPGDPVLDRRGIAYVPGVCRLFCGLLFVGATAGAAPGQPGHPDVPDDSGCRSAIGRIGAA